MIPGTKKIIEVWKESSPSIFLCETTTNYMGLFFDETPMVISHYLESFEKDIEQFKDKTGDILEVGLGMGISAMLIDKLNFKNHVILEPYEEIIGGCKRNNWWNDKWDIRKATYQEYLDSSPQETFDVIYYDSEKPLDESYKDKFISLLKQDGMFCIWAEPEKTVRGS